MYYNLYVTRRNGTTFRTLRSSYETRAATMVTVKSILAAGCQETDEITQFALRTALAPLGQDVVHEQTGITFRTEAF
jgi:hypothetical protein